MTGGWLRHSVIAAHCAVGQRWHRRGARLRAMEQGVLGCCGRREAVCYTALVNLCDQSKMQFSYGVTSGHGMLIQMGHCYD